MQVKAGEINNLLFFWAALVVSRQVGLFLCSLAGGMENTSTQPIKPNTQPAKISQEKKRIACSWAAPINPSNPWMKGQNEVAGVPQIHLHRLLWTKSLKLLPLFIWFPTRKHMDVCRTHLINKRNTAVRWAGLKIGPDLSLFTITIYKGRAFQPRTTSHVTTWAGTIRILEALPSQTSP